MYTITYISNTIIDICNSITDICKKYSNDIHDYLQLYLINTNFTDIVIELQASIIYLQIPAYVIYRYRYVQTNLFIISKYLEMFANVLDISL